MNYRLATVLDRKTEGSDVTEVIDLNLADPVSRIQLIHEPTNAASVQPTAHPARCITKIELVDGSDVLFSLSGREAQAADFYHTGKVPLNQIIYWNYNNSEMVYNLNFGRFLYDPLFAFDPSKFRNPQLKITIDINGGGCAPTTGFLTVLADIFDGKRISPEGFLMHKEVKDYVPGASAHEYTDLPVDFPYRKLFIQAHKHGTGPDYLITSVKLSEENDRKIPINATILELMKAVSSRHGPWREWILCAGGADGWHFYCTPCYAPVGNISQFENSCANFLYALGSMNGGQGHIPITGSGVNLSLQVAGWCPHGVIEVPFGLQDDPDDWYDVTQLGSLKLDILATANYTTGDSCAIFLQQLRKY
jgi:hypothetical protein